MNRSTSRTVWGVGLLLSHGVVFGLALLDSAGMVEERQGVQREARAPGGKSAGALGTATRSRRSNGARCMKSRSGASRAMAANTRNSTGTGRP